MNSGAVRFLTRRIQRQAVQGRVSACEGCSSYKRHSLSGHCPECGREEVVTSPCHLPVLLFSLGGRSPRSPQQASQPVSQPVSPRSSTGPWPGCTGGGGAGGRHSALWCRRHSPSGRPGAARPLHGEGTCAPAVLCRGWPWAETL